MKARTAKWTAQVWAAFIFPCCILFAMPANAELSVTPLRLVIDQKNTIGRFEVSNPSNRIADVKVDWIDLKATMDGYKRASGEERSSISAAPFLTVTPADLRLEPGARGIITVKLRQGIRLPKDERRSHLLVKTSALRTPLRKAGGGLEADVGIGMSMPVIIRPRPFKAEAAFGKTRLVRNKDGLLELETVLTQSGTSSVFGRLDVMLEPEGNAEYLLATLKNVAVYPDSTARKVRIELGEEYLPASRLTLRYIGEAEFNNREFAAKAFDVDAP
ncbi:MAG: hypothetical protein AAFY84_06895 [Pseudomonadota bacterium]